MQFNQARFYVWVSEGMESFCLFVDFLKNSSMLLFTGWFGKEKAGGWVT